MSETARERPSSFEEAIVLNKEMSIAEGLQMIADFHDTTSEDVRAHIFNLRDVNDGTVLFRESVMSGHKCIYMFIHDETGASRGNAVFNVFTGQQLMRTS